MTIFCERAKTRMKELHITTRQLAKSQNQDTNM